MKYMLCIAVSVMISNILTNLKLTTYDRTNSKFVKDMCETTFDGVMDVLEKANLIRKKG